MALGSKLVIVGKISCIDGNFAIIKTKDGVEKYNLDYYRIIPEEESVSRGSDGGQRTTAEHR